jgi:iron complex outermembrane recepter protein
MTEFSAVMSNEDSNTNYKRESFMLKKYLVQGSVMAIVAVAMGSTAAYAQQSASQPNVDEPNVDEILVTAQKRSQSVQSVGIAISAMTGETAEQLGMNSAQSLASSVSGVTLQAPGGPAQTEIGIRGVSTRDVSPIKEGAVVMYLDDTYFPINSAAAKPIFDIDRIEVLKGPQSTLFGRNATGGVIHIVSAQPTDTFGGYVKAGLGSFGENEAQGAINVPLASGLAGRLSGYYRQQDGWAANRNSSASGNSPSSKDYVVRGQLKYNPAGAFEATLKVDYTDSSGTDVGPIQLRAITDANGATIAPPNAAAYTNYCVNVLGLPFAPPNPDALTGNCATSNGGSLSEQNFNNSDTNYLNRVFLTSLVMKYDLGDGIDLHSVTNYHTVHGVYNLDGTATDFTTTPYSVLPFVSSATNGFLALSETHSKIFDQEVRISYQGDKIHFDVGAYYLRLTQHGDSGLGNPAAPSPFFPFIIRNHYQHSTTSYAFFGQAEYKFADTLNLTVGARWTHEQKDFDLSGNCVFALGPPTCSQILSAPPAAFIATNGLVNSAAINESKLTGKVALNYTPDSDTLFYISASRGFKAGGFNNPQLSFASPSSLPYDGETILAYEAGVKVDFLQHAVRLNAAVFHYDYHNFQNFLYVGSQTRVFNGDAKISGADVDLTFKPFKGLILQAGLSYLHSKADVSVDDVGNPVPTYTQPVPAAPSFSANLLARYQFDAFGGQAAVQTNWAYKASAASGGINDAILRLPAYWKGDARLTYTPNDGRFEIAVFARNVTDRRIDSLRAPLPSVSGSVLIFADQPRSFGGSVKFNF